jgi:AcrR family transcriptional regulator
MGPVGRYPAQVAEPQRRPGRPRDASIGERALAAARALLVERGFEATTVQAVAERAGVHASAVYRRWPTRIDLIEEAAFPGPHPLCVHPTGDLRRDLRRFVRAYAAVFNSPVARAAVAGLIAHAQSASRIRPPAYHARVAARPQFRAILEAAPDGSVDPEVDPDDVFDMLLGAVLSRTVLADVFPRPRPWERTVDMLLRLVAPPVARPVGSLVSPPVAPPVARQLAPPASAPVDNISIAGHYFPHG